MSGFCEILSRSKNDNQEKCVLKYLDASKYKTLVSAMCGNVNVNACILEITNMADIMMAYGKDECVQIVSKFEEYVESKLPQLDHVVQISINQFMLIESNSTYCQFKNDIVQLLECASFEEFKCTNGKVVLPIKAGLTFGKSNLQDLLQQSYFALSKAHVENPSSRVYCFEEDNAHHELASNNMKLAAYMLESIQKSATSLAFQPVVYADEGRVELYECLLRIRCDDGNIISAGPFIAAAELLGCIHKVDKWVLQKVVSELREHPNVNLGMNVSSLSINNEEWLNMACDLLSKSNLSHRLTVEITETGNQQNLDKMANFVHLMKEIGCKVAIDDFGAGYTSFKELKSLEVDIIKIDGEFIKGTNKDSENILFIEALIKFAKGFGVKTVAEFVENAEIANLLRDLGIDYMQGNYFGPPLNYKPWVV